MYSTESKQTFGGRKIKVGDRVVAKMVLKFLDRDGKSLPDYVGECEATCSRIDDDNPSFLAVHPDKDDKRSLELRQVGMQFVESREVLRLWTWTWSLDKNVDVN